jgi:hypothetical protein
MAKEAYYFSHDSNARHDPKISSLVFDYGMEGYGRFWVLIEMLREQSGYKLKLDDNAYKALAMQMQCKIEDVKKFINDCIDVYKLFIVHDDFIFSQSLVDRMKIKDALKKKKVKAANARWDKEKQRKKDRMQVHSGAYAKGEQCNAIKGKEIKVKEKKGNRQGSTLKDTNTNPDPNGENTPPLFYFNLSEKFYNQKKDTTNANLNYNAEKWSDELYKLERIDKYKPELIESVIMFALNDSDFWGKNLVSLASIRSKGKNGLIKFTNILAKYEEKKPGAGSQNKPDPTIGMSGDEMQKYYQDMSKGLIKQ